VDSPMNTRLAAALTHMAIATLTFNVPLWGIKTLRRSHDAPSPDTFNRASEPATRLLPEDSSPHAEALRLVFDVERDFIRQLEREGFEHEGGWWHDTHSRRWSVRRPFGPGILDSTHWFHVDLFIDEKLVASWSVDTRRKTVKRPA
jgi:hypothetical protein